MYHTTVWNVYFWYRFRFYFKRSRRCTAYSWERQTPHYGRFCFIPDIPAGRCNLHALPSLNEHFVHMRICRSHYCLKDSDPEYELCCDLSLIVLINLFICVQSEASHGVLFERFRTVCLWVYLAILCKQNCSQSLNWTKTHFKGIWKCTNCVNDLHFLIQVRFRLV